MLEKLQVQGKLKVIVMFFNTILMMATFAVCYTYFQTRLGNPVKVDIPQICYTLVGLGVIGISVASALFHIIGGGIMGMTAGGVLGGMKIGMFLGLASAVGRLWLFAGAACGASVLSWPDHKFYTISLGVMTIICFLIQRGSLFMWSKLQTQ
ncbi:MAG: hypothetical protein GY793_09475 [Proteobacteria bacterium]|nr:hypothetical protein [Pseudomonadota bacterium]